MPDPIRHLPDLLRELSPRRLRPPRPAVQRYVWAAVGWTVALTLTVALAPYVHHASFTFFWAAVLFAAWYGGFAPALLAAAASVVAVRWVVFASAAHEEPFGTADLLTLGIFTVAALTVSALTARLARAQRRSQRTAEELAALAEQLQDQSVELEQQTEEAQALAEELGDANGQLAVTAARAEESRDEAERGRAQLRAVLDAMPDAAWVCDAAWRVAYLNPAAQAAARAVGADPAALVGREAWDGFPLLRGRLPDEACRAVAEGRSLEVEEYAPPPLDRWFEVRVSPTLDGAVLLARDVTARKRTERGEQLLSRAGAIFASSLDHRTTVRQVAELAVPTLADWCAIDLLDLSTGALEELAVAHADPSRVEWARELRHRYPPDPGAATGAAAVLRSGKTQLYPEVTDEMLRAAARDEEHLRLLRQVGFHSAVILPLVAHGRTLGTLTLVWADSRRRYDPADVALAEELARRAALAIDNARLFAAEQVARRTAERLQSLTAALSGAVTPAAVGAVVLEHGVRALGARSGVVALVTADGAEIELVASTGYPPEACMGPGRRWPAGAAIPIAEAARTGEPVIVESVEAWAARYGPGSYRPPRAGNAAWAAFPLGTGATRGALLWTFDDAHAVSADERDLMATVTRLCTQALERARLFEAEQRARQDAEAANRAKSEFLATMSHELRTPINAALGYADLMALGIRGPVTDAQQDDLARLRRSQQRLLNLVNDVLSFARIESGRIEYRTTDVPLDEVLAGAEALVAPLLRAKGLGYEYRPVDEALLVRADRERLEQILVNLLSNAVKFTDAGGRVTVSAEATERAVRVCVTDSGRGIPADKLEAIFEPFVQVEQGLTRSAEGTGLGLAISREMARAMGSDLTAVSTVGVGSTFTLTLPRSGVRAFLEPPSPPPAGAADGRRDGTVPERGSADPT